MIFIRNVYFVHLDTSKDVLIDKEEATCITNKGKVNDIAPPVNMTSKPIPKAKDSKLLASSSGLKRSMTNASKGKKISIIPTEEDILWIRKRKLVLECTKLHLEAKEGSGESKR